MKAIQSLMGVALAATALTFGTAAQAQHSGGGHSGGGGGHGGGSGGGWHGGSSGGGWHGGSGGWHGGYWHGGHYHSYYYPTVGFYWGWPAYWGPWWGYPYYYDYYPYGSYGYAYPPYPGDGYPQAYPEGTMPPSDVAPSNAPGGPTQAPTYMNYCESAKAYFPKVTTCPEGWKFVTPQ